MKRMFFSAITHMLGRRAACRIGRSLYMYARADYPNIMAINGEQLMQRQLLGACANGRIKPVIFDVGANVGEWTSSLLQIYKDLRMDSGIDVHCFEPVPATFDALKRRMGSSPHGVSVRVISQALSQQPGTTEMYIVGEQAGTNSLHRDGTPDVHGISIQMTTADDYCMENTIPLIHYLKCDTEGHDVEVLSGAMRLLIEERIMTFQFEYNHRWVYSRHYLRDVFERIRNLPYQVGKLTPIGVEMYDEWHPELERFFEGNYALIHKRALPWYSVRTGTFDQSNSYST